MPFDEAPLGYTPDEIREQDKAIEQFGGLDKIKARMRSMLVISLSHLGPKIDTLADELTKRYGFHISPLDLVDMSNGNTNLRYSIYKYIINAAGILNSDPLGRGKGDWRHASHGLRRILDRE